MRAYTDNLSGVYETTIGAGLVRDDESTRDKRTHHLRHDLHGAACVIERQTDVKDVKGRRDVDKESGVGEVSPGTNPREVMS